MPDRHSARLMTWLEAEALPLWSSAGYDSRGAFRECLDLEGRVQDGAPLRLRVQARQIYVYAHAQVFGLGDWAGQVSDAVDWLTAHGWSDEKGGFVHRLSPEGEVLDDLCDAYDHAFVLLALSWAYRATGRADVRDWIARTADAVETLFGVEGERAFREDDRNSLPRRQNPHMHLLEAFLAAHEATREPRYLERARDMVGLFHDVFFREDSGTLTEFFEADWRPCEDPRGEIVEPGHLFEWVFLLHAYAQASGTPVSPAARTLFETARARGIDGETGLAVDEIWRADGMKKTSKRCWPQTEALRAHVVMAQDNPALWDDVAGWIDRLFTYYLDAAHPGGWNDVRDEANAPVSTQMPASTFYHVFGAFMAVLVAAPLEADRGPVHASEGEAS